VVEDSLSMGTARVRAQDSPHTIIINNNNNKIKASEAESQIAACQLKGRAMSPGSSRASVQSYSGARAMQERHPALAQR
jgi:hypothetical protein